MNSTEEDKGLRRPAEGTEQLDELPEDSKRPNQSEPISGWDGLVERKIRKAQKQGLFDDLPGKGEPLNLSENPFLDPSWRTAYKLLQDQGFAPEWIELDKEIRIELEGLRQRLAESKRWYNGAIAALEGRTGHRAKEERAWVEVYWERRLNSLTIPSALLSPLGLALRPRQTRRCGNRGSLRPKRLPHREGGWLQRA